jgi:hypothetical protein
MNDSSKVGYEYGIRPDMILLGDMDFSKHFIDAKCLGLMYMFGIDNKSNQVPVQIAFIFQNEDPAKLFFDCLLHWVKNSDNDGDAVSIEFIENLKGGYTLAIYPEIERFIKRMIPDHLIDRVSPIMMTQTQYKEIEQVSPSYHNFKSNWEKARKIAIGYVIGSPGKIQKQSTKYFTKSEFKFYQKDNIPLNSAAEMYNLIQKKQLFNKNNHPSPPKDSLEDISKRRKSEIKNFFPVTYNKIVNNNWLSTKVNELEKRKYNFECIIQAICNIILFERIKQDRSSLDDNVSIDNPINILDYLLSTYESFSSYFPDDSFFSISVIENQIVNDKNELETYLRK